MRYQVELTLRHIEGALIRALGLAERRGFRPLAVEGAVNAGEGTWSLRLTVEGERSDEALSGQLRKLHDCLDVAIVPLPPQSHR